MPPLRFIADSSPRGSLVGMSATQLENASFQVTNHKEHRKHVVVRLLAEGSVVVALIAIGWLGMWNVGSDTLSSQSDSFTAQRDPIYVAGCPVPDPLENGSAREDIGKGRGCTEGGSSHPITSRQPGVGLGGRGHGAERQTDDRVPPRTSENSTSRHSAENREAAS